MEEQNNDTNAYTKKSQVSNQLIEENKNVTKEVEPERNNMTSGLENKAANEESKINLRFLYKDKVIDYDETCTCINEVKFEDIVEKLCNNLPELKNYKNLMFLKNGNMIDIKKTFQENGIEEGDNILIIAS